MVEKVSTTAKAPIVSEVSIDLQEILYMVTTFLKD